jgi:hypothetical protein
LKTEHNGIIPVSFNEKQAIAFESEATEILYGGAAGGGKSFLMRIAAISWATEIPNLSIYLFRRSYTDLEETHMKGPKGFRTLLKPWVDAGLVKIVEHEIRFLTNGSTIKLAHLHLEQDVEDYQSYEMHVLMIDEASSFTENMYRRLRSRVRAVGLEYPDKWKGKFPRILLSANPGGIGAHWIKAFIASAPDGKVHQMPPSEGGKKRQFIQAVAEDNPHLLKDDPGYLDTLEGLGSPALVRAMRYGDWTVIAGQFFPEFDIARHVIPKFKIPSHWTRFCAGDMGYTEPCAFVWFAVASEKTVFTIGAGNQKRTYVVPEGALVCYEEFYGIQYKEDGTTIFNSGIREPPAEIAKRIKEHEKRHPPVSYRVLDPSAFAHKSGPSEAEMMAKEGVRFRRADNTRVPRAGNRGGWLELRHRLRGNGVTPMIFFFEEECEHIIRTFPAMVHDSANPEDMVTRRVEDHLMDAIRYACMSRPMKAPKPAKVPVFRPPTLGELAIMAEQQAASRKTNRI